MGFIGAAGTYMAIKKRYNKNKKSNVRVYKKVDAQQGQRFQGNFGTSSLGGGAGKGYLSQYHDATSVYRRKRAPRKVRKAARRKFKDYLHNSLRMANKQVYKFNQGGVEAVAADNMGWMCIPGLYSLGGSTDGWKDIYQMMVSKGTIANAGQSGGTPDFYQGGKLFVQSAKLEVAIANVNETPIQIWVYECIARKRPRQVLTGPNALLTTSTNFLDAQGAAEVDREFSDNQGSSLFDFNSFTSNILITKVHKHYIGGLQSIELQMSDNKDRIISPDDVYNSAAASSALHAGMTKFYVIGFQGTLINDTGSAEYEDAGIAWKSHRTYFCKYLEDKPVTNTVYLGNMNN